MPYHFAVFGAKIPTSPILLALGLLLGVGVTYLEGRRRLNGPLAFDLGAGTVLGGFAGGWLGYLAAIWLNLERLDLAPDWGRVLAYWGGQISFHAAFLGGLTAIGLFTLSRRRVGERVLFLELADVITPGLAWGLTSVWIVSFALGQVSLPFIGDIKIGLGYVLLPRLEGVEFILGQIFNYYHAPTPAFALQGIGIGLSLMLGLAFWLLRRRWPFSGAAFLTFVLLYFTEQFLIEIAGEKYGYAMWKLYLGPWRMGQVFDVGFVSLAAIGLLVFWGVARRRGAKAAPMGKSWSFAIPLVVGLALAGLIAGAIVASQIRRPEHAEEDNPWAHLPYPNVGRISPQEALTLVETGVGILVDTRPQAAYVQSHAKGAYFLPETEIDSLAASGQLERFLNQTLPMDKMRIVYQRGDDARAAQTLLENGFIVVALLGGWEAWQAAGLPVESSAGQFPFASP